MNLWSGWTLFFTLTVVTFSAQLAAANFIFQFELSDVVTHVNCKKAFDEYSPVCETYLSIFCLRLQSETSGCSLGSSGQYGPDKFNFPITRQISSASPWPIGFQLFIRAKDHDDGILNSDDHLDDIFINQFQKPNKGYSRLIEYYGNNQKVSVSLRYRIDCQSNYYGRNCVTFCVAQNDDVNGHYTCNSADGSIQCRDGFEHPSNNCRDRITACSGSPCAQDAPCTPIGLTDYSCDCPPGYTGKSCETDINECDPSPCQNNATCVDVIADYNCQCLAGYSGRNCGIDIDDCAGVECPGNSTCIDGVDSFTCVCNHGFEGENCTEINPCDSIPCANGGNCTPMGPFNYSCECAAGYTGTTCEVDIDECLTAVCPANSSCVDAVNSYTCVCNPGFEGEECAASVVMPLEQLEDTTAQTQQKVLKMIVIIGPAIAIGGLTITIIAIIIVIICICIRRRRKYQSYYLAECEIYTSRGDHSTEEDQLVLSNPLYGSPQHQNGISSQSAEPYRSYANFSTTESPEHSSTLHIVSNPIYGTQSQPSSSDGAYSAPMAVTQDYTTVTFKGNENEAVDTSGTILVEISESSAV